MAFMGSSEVDLALLRCKIDMVTQRLEMEASLNTEYEIRANTQINNYAEVVRSSMYHHPFDTGRVLHLPKS
jgi:hypothetical protein